MTTEPITIHDGPFSGESEEVNCPICEDPPPPKLIYKRSNKVGIWQCPGCELMFASPRFTEKSLLEIYETPDFVPTDVYKLYEGWDYEKWKASEDESFTISSLKVDNVKKHLSTGDRVLDVGCGVGLFVTEAQRQGLKADGIEPSKMLCDIAANIGIDIKNCLIEDFKPSYKYKGVVVWDVLEHVYDPIRILRQCHELTEEGGYLFISVPNFASITDRLQQFLYRTKLRKGQYKHFGFPWHIYSYNRKSLKALLEKSGYQPLVMEAPSHHARRGTGSIFSKIIEPVISRKCLGANLTCIARKKVKAAIHDKRH